MDSSHKHLRLILTLICRPKTVYTSRRPYRSCWRPYTQKWLLWLDKRSFTPTNHQLYWICWIPKIDRTVGNRELSRGTPDCLPKLHQFIKLFLDSIVCVNERLNLYICELVWLFRNISGVKPSGGIAVCSGCQEIPLLSTLSTKMRSVHHLPHPKIPAGFNGHSLHIFAVPFSETIWNNPRGKDQIFRH